jgi:hypothetical protein
MKTYLHRMAKASKAVTAIQREGICECVQLMKLRRDRSEPERQEKICPKCGRKKEAT